MIKRTEIMVRRRKKRNGLDHVHIYIWSFMFPLSYIAASFVNFGNSIPLLSVFFRWLQPLWTQDFTFI